MPWHVVRAYDPDSVEWDGKLTIINSNCAVADITNENYLHEAELISNAPSRTIYTDGNGHSISNLGAHEHWNNSEQKLYSRNLGKSEGIELVRIGK